MAFSLVNAGATCQRLPDWIRVLLSWLRLLGYIDDYTLLSESFLAHLASLREHFRLLKFGLRIKREKYHFCCTSLEYLGHVITIDEISRNPQEAKAITKMAEPRSLKQLVSFLAICSWYR